MGVNSTRYFNDRNTVADSVTKYGAQKHKSEFNERNTVADSVTKYGVQKHQREFNKKTQWLIQSQSLEFKSTRESSTKEKHSG